MSPLEAALELASPTAWPVLTPEGDLLAVCPTWQAASQSRYYGGGRYQRPLIIIDYRDMRWTWDPAYQCWNPGAHPC